MFLEDILPQIRAGAKFRRKQWMQAKPGSYVQVVWDDPDYGSCFSDEMGCFESKSICIDWFKYDDWELVPEPKPKKFQSWVKLYDNGSVFGYESLEKSMESVTLAEYNGKAKLVETRVIEWSVE